MPKVTQEYIINKKKKITHAAYELCLEKTVCTVTMQDIINRTCLSQGGIYRFYRDIDEIFGDMLAELRERTTIKEALDELLAREDSLSGDEIIDRVFDMLAVNMEKELLYTHKIDFEMSMLAINAPERVNKILAGAKGISNKEYLMMRTVECLNKKIARGELKPRIDGAELIAYISASYTGIQSTCIIQACYNKMPVDEIFQPRMRFRILAKSVKYFLGISE